MDKLSELKAAAMAATPQHIDGAQERSEDGYMECPCCSGDGQVDVGADYCNYDNTALGVIFYGIGDAHVAAERYFRAANPAAVLTLLAELETKDKRILELDYLRLSACEVFKEIGNELGCNPDNESIMMAIDELKATQVTGPLALIIKRTGEMERILEGVTPEMISGGWTAKGISDYAKSLEAKLATPVRLPNKNDDEFWFDDVFQVAKFDRAVERAISAAGFKFVGDE